MKTRTTFLVIFLMTILSTKYSIAQQQVFNVNTITTLNVYDFYQTTDENQSDTISVAYGINQVSFQMGNTDYCPDNLECPDYFVWTFTESGTMFFNFKITLYRDDILSFYPENSKGKYRRVFVIDPYTDCRFIVLWENPPKPTAYDLTGSGSYCQGGSGKTITLSDSEENTSYQLKKDGTTDVGSPKIGTGSSLQWTGITAGSYTCIATNDAGNTTMNGTVVITETAILVNLGPDRAICQGSSTTLDAGITGAGVNYLWGPDGQTTQTIEVSTADTYSVSVAKDGCFASDEVVISVNPVYNTEFSASICNGGSYSWQGSTYTIGGDYTKVLQSIHGCDSTVTLHLTVNPVYNTEFSASICNGGSYSWQGSTYTIGGDYTKILQSIHGCDSTVTLHLTVNPVYHTEFSTSICNGGSYSWQGSTYTIGGDYTKVLQSIHGCDSTVTLHLTVNPVYNTEFSASICNGGSYSWQGSTYTIGGDYTKILQSIHGCDSTVTLHLSVVSSFTTEFSQAICNGSSYVWQGTTYVTAGDYTKTLQSIHGCDSTVTLHLTVNPVYNTEFSASICNGGSYSWQGSSYTVSGDYTKTLQSQYGCDSTVTLHLTVNNLPTVSITQTPGNGQVTLDAGTGFSSYLWTPGNQNTQTIIVTQDGNYTVLVTNEFGCEASANTNVTITGIEDTHQEFAVKAYPNPVKDYLTIEFSSTGYVEVINTIGVVVLQKKVRGNDVINMTGLRPGIYLVKTTLQDNLQPVILHIVKQ